MRLATIRVPSGTKAVMIDGEEAEELGYASVGELLSNPSWESDLRQTGVYYETDGLDYATLIPLPSKIICVGHNYRNHIKEMGRELPTHPTLFAKFTEAPTLAAKGAVKEALSQYPATLGLHLESKGARPLVEQFFPCKTQFFENRCV